MGKVTQKPWGETEAIHESALMSAHRMDILPGGFCSKHLHERKWNAFVVVFGQLHIFIQDEDQEPVRAFGKRSYTRHVLRAGDFIAVPPGRRHWFAEATGDLRARAVEWYWPDELGEDIVRFSESGRKGK